MNHRFRISFHRPDGMTIHREIDLPIEVEYISGIEIQIQTEDAAWAPISRIPLALHEPGYHTVCYRGLDEEEDVKTEEYGDYLP